MNKLIEAIRQRIAGAIAKVQSIFQDEKPGDVEQITNKTLDDSRKEVIKKGRQHVAPVSASKAKVLIVSIVISVVGLLIMGGVYWSQVYRSVSLSSLVYDASQIIPTPVAVLGEDKVYYDQVLFQHNTALKVRGQSAAESAQNKDEILGIAFEKVFENSAIQQLARKQNITVSEEEISTRVALLEETTGSSEKFEASLKTDYGWTRRDFLREFRIQLLKEKLTPTALDEVATRLNQGDSFKDLQAEYNDPVNPQSFNLDDSDSQDGLPPEVISRAKELTDDLVSDQINTEIGVYYLERKGQNINVITIDSKAANRDIEVFIEDSQQFVCLNVEGLSYEKRSFRACAF